MTPVTEIILVTRNARDKVQVVIATLSSDKGKYIINRSTGQYLGKMTNQPELIIEVGKVKRSILQQATLEFTSIINKYKDKGYKELSSLTKIPFEELSNSQLNNLVPTIRTDDNGNCKPMLAKDFNKCQNSVLQKLMYCSRKLNGVRCMIKWSAEEESPITISRGGKNYNISAANITEELAYYLEQNPDIILDGELYVHGQYLQKISGIARLETWEPRCETLEYWIYDIASDKLIFEKRLEILDELKEIFKSSKKIKILEHVKTESWDQIQKLHDKWVSEGFEGLVARKPDKVYEFGKRGSTMIKVKAYKEEEFEIIDYSEKLREEDFCFICKTSEGKVFEAKPIGSREVKAEYIDNMDNIIGKMGTVKFFEYSKDGTPLQAIFQAVRDYE